MCAHADGVDSVHSVIEQAKKGTEVFIPKDWINITQKAEKTNPYLVPLLNHDDLKDAKFFVANQKCNLKLLATGKKIDWRQVRWIWATRIKPTTVQIWQGRRIAEHRHKVPQEDMM